jgi:hypothetical protein
LSSNEDSPAGHLVAGVLESQSQCLGIRGGRKVLTVSMYSPLGARRDMVGGRRCRGRDGDGGGRSRSSRCSWTRGGAEKMCKWGRS